MRDVTPGGRRPRNQLWKRSDGRFSAVAEARSNHHTFRVRTWFTGQKQVTEPHPTADLAVEAARALWADYEAGRLAWEPPPETVGELAQRYAARRDVDARHLGAWERQAATLVRRLARVRLDELSVRAVRAAFDAAWAPGTHNLYRIRLSQLLGWAVERGWLERDPTEAVPTRSDPRDLLPWLPRSDWPALLGAIADEGARLRVELLLRTGLRIGEAIHLTREDVDLGAATPVVRVRAHPEFEWSPKTRRSIRAVPLDSRAVALVRRALELWPDHGRLLGLVSRSTVGGTVRLACAAAGLQPIGPHGLRRSAGAAWLELGVPLLLVSRWLGHGSAAITERCYAGISDPLTAQGVAALEAGVEAWESGRVVPMRGRRP